MMQKRTKDRERQKISLHVKYHIGPPFLLANSSLNMRMLPGKWGVVIEKQNQLPHSLSQSMKHGLLSACSAITHNLLSVVPGTRSACRWRINEMPRWKERNCLYNLPSRCLSDIFKNKSHRKGELWDQLHFERLSTHNLLFLHVGIQTNQGLPF